MFIQPLPAKLKCLAEHRLCPAASNRLLNVGVVLEDLRLALVDACGERSGVFLQKLLPSGSDAAVDASSTPEGPVGPVTSGYGQLVPRSSARRGRRAHKQAEDAFLIFRMVDAPVCLWHGYRDA